MSIVFPVERYGPVTQRWSPVLVTPSATVLALADAKLHARIDADDEDSLLVDYTMAAQQQVENDTGGYKLLTQTWDLVGDGFPSWGWIELPFGPLQSVTHIKSYDSATPSVLQTMTAGDYLADVVRIPGRIGLADGKYWPTDLRAFQPVTMRVVVGYDSIAKIPEPLLHAVRLALAWHAGKREPTTLERQSYDWLLDPYRLVTVA